MQSDSDNSGATSADFLTGNGGALPAGTPIASGTSVGWETEFDNGMSYSAAVGYRYSPSFRGEVQLAMSKADVDTHKNVMLGGGSIDALDAGALTGSADTLGVTVAEKSAENHHPFGMNGLAERDLTLDVDYAFAARINGCGNTCRRAEAGIAQ